MESRLKCLLNVLLMVLLWPIKQLGLLITNYIYGGPNVPLPPIRDEFLKETATEIAAKIRNKEISALEVVKACIRRIEEINGISNCVVADRFEEALKEAQAVDLLLAEGSKAIEEIEKETPFLGVPFTAKNGIAIKDHSHTSGLICRKDLIAAEDAGTVALLKKAGAIPLATTNVPEMMMWWETNNTLFGRCRNPYHSQYIVGGSSGGEAAVLSAAGSFMGIGSDLGGSIRLPAYMCGIFGHFPSRRVVPSTGHYPEAEPHLESMGSLGPMSRSAKDLLPMLKVLTKDSKVDLKLDEKVDLKKLRYYYMEDNGGHPLVTGIDSVDPRVKAAVDKVIDYFLETYGITVVKVNIKEMANGLDLWWGKAVRRGGAPSLAEKINGGKFKSNIPLEILKGMFGLSEHTVEMMVISAMEEAAHPYGSPGQIEAEKKAARFEKTLVDLLRDDGVFIYPTQPTPPMKHTQTILRGWNIGYTAIFNAGEFPVTQCPITRTEEGLPIGIQVAASPFQDRLTLAVAEELEKAFGGWVPPPSK